MSSSSERKHWSSTRAPVLPRPRLHRAGQRCREDGEARRHGSVPPGRDRTDGGRHCLLHVLSRRGEPGLVSPCGDSGTGAASGWEREWRDRRCRRCLIVDFDSVEPCHEIAWTTCVTSFRPVCVPGARGSRGSLVCVLVTRGEWGGFPRCQRGALISRDQPTETAYCDAQFEHACPRLGLTYRGGGDALRAHERSLSGARKVCMVRMQADARLPPEQRLGYKHVGDALVRIAREEGLATYWRGATPTGEGTRQSYGHGLQSRGPKRLVSPERARALLGITRSPWVLDARRLTLLTVTLC